jgi:hypothetical protein
MVNYSQQMATALAAATKGVIGVALMRVTEGTPNRPRPVSEILDIRQSFVCGYPQHLDGPICSRDEVD